jgi:hypothetical protein
MVTNGVNFDDGDILTIFSAMLTSLLCLFANSTSFSLVHHIQFANLLGPLCHFLPSHQLHITNNTLQAHQSDFIICATGMCFELLKI